jgi:hypothetical protein
VNATLPAQISVLRPGASVDRLARLVRAAVQECALDLSGAVVLTEAATGPYAVTPVLAAAAGADRVIALTRPTRYGTVDQVRAETHELAERLGVADRITVTTDRSPADFAAADIVTNSGHVRPIDAHMVAAMKHSAVVSLMFEAWEAEAGRSDLDLDALYARGIRVAGTNERHPAVDVFSYLGLMAVKLLLDAGVAPYRGHIAVLCDNPFRPFLERGLRAAGARVSSADSLAGLGAVETPDALLLALKPTGGPVLSAAELFHIASRWPDCVLAQYWGDLDREDVHAAALPVWPPSAPAPGHMGVLPSAVGPEPIVRLQAGGLKVAQVLRRPPAQRTPADLEFVDEL